LADALVRWALLDEALPAGEEALAATQRMRQLKVAMVTMGKGEQAPSIQTDILVTVRQVLRVNIILSFQRFWWEGVPPERYSSARR
jgi:hypothetical protein